MKALIFTIFVLFSFIGCKAQLYETDKMPFIPENPKYALLDIPFELSNDSTASGWVLVNIKIDVNKSEIISREIVEFKVVSKNKSEILHYRDDSNLTNYKIHSYYYFIKKYIDELKFQRDESVLMKGNFENWKIGIKLVSK